jgi:S1-C subfamily serine protease
VLGLASTASAGESDVKVIEHLQDVSVTIKASSGTGSGVVVTRKRGDETHNFIWTAAHVVEDLRSTRKVIDPKTGTERTLVEFKDATIVKEMIADGRKVGSMELLASVIRYSADEDLALLRVRKKNFLATGASFALDKSPSGEPIVPSLNTDLLHVGSLLGQMGSNSLTRGVLSQVGRLIDDRVFDQTSVIAFPGSSGGGVFFQDGRMMGMLVRGAGPGFNLIVPVRRILGWAKDANVEWAIDPAILLPSDDDLKKLPIEDVGAVFTASSAKEEAKPDAKKVSFEPLFLHDKGEGK